MTKKQIDELAEELSRKWQEHGRQYSTAIFEYKRWRQMVAEDQEKYLKRMWFHLSSLKEWMERMENHQWTYMDELNKKKES